MNGLVQLVRLCADHQVDAKSLLQAIDVAPDTLRDPHGWITAQQEFRFVQALREQLAQPSLGLLAGQRYRLGALGVLGSAVLYCATAQDAVEFFMQHIGLSYTYFQVTFAMGDQIARLDLLDQIELGELRRFFLDRDLLFAVNAVRDVLALPPQNAVLRVRLAYPRPPEADQYREIFGCEVCFAAEVSGVDFAAAVLRMPLPQANELTLKLLEEQCQSVETRLQPVPRLGDQVRRLLAQSGANPPSLEALAARLHITGRTLRRRLKDEGLTYRHLLHEMRLALARQWLMSEAMPVEEIAERLGYAEAASFIHAFKKWTGLPPGQYRRQEAEQKSGDRAQQTD